MHARLRPKPFSLLLTCPFANPSRRRQLTAHVRAFRLTLARSTKRPAMTVTLDDASATLLAASEGGLLRVVRALAHPSLYAAASLRGTLHEYQYAA
ncbi:hypothetical protein [Streptomyces scabiei]|uniref:hypothetical protein n=1 Tax=Streptomyces scabiei TaxID=1930 RepID=UPI001B33153C|nr:hypothetical protein [Streptomyces sp. LBUM 1488]MBP5897997.1 hypothetical protein [Streptomyces sp. LBUM 1488]